MASDQKKRFGWVQLYEELGDAGLVSSLWNIEINAAQKRKALYGIRPGGFTKSKPQA